MYNNVLYTSLMILLICCSSCNNGNTASKQSKPTIGFTTDTLSIDNVSNKNYPYLFKMKSLCRLMEIKIIRYLCHYLMS